MKPECILNRALKPVRALLIFLPLLLAALPAAAVFKADLQATDFGTTNWSGGPVAGWRELDLIPCRVLFTGGPQSNYVVTINFDHTRGTSRGIENLTGFTPSTNVIINSGPTLSAPTGVDIWTYTLNVTVTNAAPAQIFYTAALSAGSHNFGGASLAMGGVAQLQIQKPAVVLGSPDMAITKVGATQARTNQILTYVITYTNKLIAAQTALGVQVIDTLPPQVTYVPGSGSKGVKVLGNTLTWNLGNLAPGKSGFLTYKVMVTNNIPVTTTFANFAEILGSQNDANTADNTAVVNTTVVVIPTPLAGDDFYAIGKNQTLTVAAPGVMLNDSNALSASLLAGPANGSVTFNTNGSFTYVPATNFLGSDSFAYLSLNSSNMSGPAIVTIDVTNTCFVLSIFTTITNNTPGQCGAAVNFTLPATTGDCASFSYSPTNGSFFPIGATTVTFTNTDGVSNAFQVFVVDTESPTITCPSNMVFSTSAGQCSRSNVTFNVAFSDNCPGASLLQNSGLTNGATYPVGVTTNMFTATDASGNTESCSFTVAVLDNDPPAISCPPNVVVAAAAGGCSSNVTFNVTAIDGCGSVASLVSVPASGSAFPTGVTIVTNTATDASGNTSTCTFTVTVLDAQPPAITCPAPISVAANNGACAATNVNLGTPITSDNCGVATVTNNASASFPVGTNFVTWTVVDNGGNVVTCQQAVIVSDNQPPVINCPADVTAGAATGSCAATNVALGNPAVSDNCGSVTVTNDAPAQFAVGTNVVTWTARDASGNTATCQQRVIVQDSQAPAINCPASILLEADPGQCSRSNVAFTVTASDNCSGVSVVSIPPSGSTFPLGTTTVTNIATDASGNQTICTFSVNTFSVTINDTQPPVISCPSNLVLAATAGQCSRSNVTFLVTATDNCTVTNLVSTPASGSTFPAGVTTVTNIATDAAGNQAVCTFTVTVTDGQAPTINCPANMSVVFPPGVAATNVSFTVTATDACGLSNLQSLPPSGSVFTAGVTTVTNTATDNSGNSSTCTFTITVTVANSTPVANAQNVSTPEDTVLPITLTGSDLDGNPLTYVLVGGPTNGVLSGFNTNTGVLTYSPNTNFTGSDAFLFRVSDGQTNSSVAVVNVTVTPVNDTPFANNQSVTTPEDTALPITLTGSDVEGTSVTFILVSGPGNGSFSGFNTNSGALTYTPATNYNGADSFTFRTSDGTNTSALATVSITVTPVNDAPIANNQSVSTLEDTALPITLTGSDAEGAALTYILINGPVNGTLAGFNTNTGALTFTPGTNYNGADSLTFRVSDGTNLSAVATVSITVTPVNDAPLAISQNVSTPEDTALPITLTGSDVEGTPVTFILVSSPGNGSVSGFNTNTGALTYAPNTNYNGADSFTFRTSDGTNTSALATVSITVTPVNDAPIANNDFTGTPRNVPVTINVLANDSDVDGNPISLFTQSTTNGALSVVGTNLFFTPASNYIGQVVLTYTITDGNSAFATAFVFVNVTNGTNTPPVANNDAVSIPEDTTLRLDPRVNDNDADGDPFFISGVVATNGAASVLGGTNVSYLPPTNFVGTVTLIYTINDGNGGTASAAITVTVTPVNDAPFANNQSVSTPEDTALPIALTGSDVEGSPLTFILVGGPANGSLSGFNTNTGALTYTPGANYTGSDSFTFRVNDGTTNSAVATVSITVTPVNDAPLANGQSVSTPEDTALPITLTGSDVEGSPLTFVLVSGPANGSLSSFNTNTGALNYTPNTNYTGADSFTFRVNDGTTNSSVATVSITVNPVNDAPLANNQSVSTPEDTALPITLTGSDVEGTALTFILVSGPANGALSGFNTNTGALTYMPNTNFSGADSFTFRTSDGTNTSAVATVSITVTPVNDAPLANSQSVSTPEDTALQITLTGSDVEGSPLTFVLVSGPANGSLSSFNTNTGALTYTPNTNYTGADSLTFRISDGTNTSAVATVNITVTPVNDAPIANNQSVSTPEDTARPITLTGSDVEGSPLTFILVSSPANGSLSGFNTNTGALTYSPNTNYSGADTFTFRASDGTNTSALATVSITVTPVNDVPLANSQSVSTPEDTALPITLTGSDVEGTPVTYILVAGPTHGTISGFNTNSGTLTYAPATNYTGADSFTFRTSDGTNSSAVATVSITVTPVNDPPVANSQNVIVTEDTAAPITLTGSDVDGSLLTFILVSGPANGVLSGFNTNTGALTYTPNTNYNGSDSFTFRVSDGTNLSAVATISITVIPVADEPRAVNQGLTTPEDTALPITLVGSSADGNPLTYQLISAPTHGAFTGLNTNTGVLTYQPATNYNGPDSFTFRVHDGFTNSLVATVGITVTPVNEPPILVNDVTNTPSGQPVVVPPLVNDINPDGGPLTISCAFATNGTAMISGTNIIFTSASNFVGTATVTYCATNQTAGSGSATITVTVTPPMDPTFAVAQGTNYVNPQSGLVEQRVTVTNTSLVTASAFRLLVGNINSPQGVPRTNVWLYNATGTNVDSRPYVLHNAPLNPGQFVTLTLEFVVPDRRPFTNSLEVVQVLPVTTGTNAGSGVAIDRSFLDNRFLPVRFVIEWTSLPGRTYTVIYSDDNMATWHAATPSVNAVNTRTQWYDDGPPKTASVPLSQGSRYYRVILAPLN